MSAVTATAPDFYDELTTRNSGFILAGTQNRLAQARILVAGCGSTGGAAVDPLTRIGVQNFILADNGEYELNNLNRQHAQLSDVGRNKAVVGAERVLDINPHAQVDVHPKGIEAATVDSVVAGCSVVIDGVDVTERSGIAAKFALHASAARLRVPVISGYDMAGMQYVRCYDYRVRRLPLDGAVTAADIENSTSWQILDRLIPRRRVPVEMIRSLHGSLNDPDYHVSQLVYTSLMFGAITSRMAVEIIGGRRVRRQVAIDIHHAVRRPFANVRLTASKPIEIFRILRSL